MGAKGFRDSLRAILPRWLGNRLGKNVGYRFLYALVRPFDIAMQASIEGVRAAWPGNGTPTALPYIGRSRGILRGEAQTDTQYAASLIPWLDDWSESGSAEILCKRIQDYLGNTPTVRIVSRSGFWVSIDPSGNTTTALAAWNWDGVSNPERANFWSDMWIIIYPSEWTTSGSSLADVVGKWYTPSYPFGLGQSAPRAAVDAILRIIADWKGLHTYVRSIIFSYDATWFAPGGANNPDGTWGLWSKVVAGNAVPTRTHQARYWDPPNG